MKEEELYKQYILDLYRNPHNKRIIPDAPAEHAANPSCGDELALYLDIHGDVIRDAAFEGEGCAISIAAASLLTDALRGKTLKDARIMTPGDMYDMLGITISPARSKCALLAYRALCQALAKR